MTESRQQETPSCSRVPPSPPPPCRGRKSDRVFLSTRMDMEIRYFKFLVMLSSVWSIFFRMFESVSMTLE